MDALLQRFRTAAAGTHSASGSALLRVCVVGGGPGGVEVALSLARRLEDERRAGGWGQAAVAQVT